MLNLKKAEGRNADGTTFNIYESFEPLKDDQLYPFRSVMLIPFFWLTTIPFDLAESDSIIFQLIFNKFLSFEKNLFIFWSC